MSGLTSGSMQADRLKVPGAVIYHEIRGQGPLLLMIPGGPTDANVLDKLADLLAKDFRVITYDPRGNSRSLFDGGPVDQNLDVHGDDAAALIQRYGSSARVFGNSGGAQIALNLTARHPEMVKRVVAHEPPCIRLLPEARDEMQKMDDVVATYQSSGVGAAMGAFMKMAGMTPPSRPGTEAPADSDSPRGRFANSNLEYFLAHGVKPIAQFKPDVDKLRGHALVIGVGTESKGQLAHRASEALARELGVTAVQFPGDHSGWVRDPSAFARVLREQLR